MAFYPIPLILLSANPPPAGAASSEKENEVKLILQRMENDVLAFRDEMERAYGSRCDASTLSQCARGNFNDCSSTYPNQQCMKADEDGLSIPACGDGKSCNALWDKSRTAVRIPGNLARGALDNPNDPEVVESVCYSRLAEPYMVDNYKAGNQMYFGSSTGAFRIMPARHSEVCGEYDPRRRPWFVAASSGPKDVVLVIDVSGSMDDYGRMDLAKDAAKTIVDTLTVADRIAIVAFSDTASQIGGHAGLIRATSENKRALAGAVDALAPNGATNFYDAFGATFEALDSTIRSEATTGCNVAVLFMTDGQITAGGREEEVIGLVNERTARLAAEHKRTTTIFTYSLGQLADHAVTKSIACSTGGIWTPVDDFTDDLVAAMSSYYKLYALGLGEGGNEDFTAWVEPYAFHTGKKMGTSVSTPVYDRSVYPPLFLGVATVDMYMDALELILGEEASSSTMLDRFVLLSTAVCPRIELTEYELDALRFLGGGEEATCGAREYSTSMGSAQFPGILSEECPFQSDLPNNLWDNTDMRGMNYKERVCCEQGGVVPSNICLMSTPPEDGTSEAKGSAGQGGASEGKGLEGKDESPPDGGEPRPAASAGDPSSVGSTSAGMIVDIVVGVVAFLALVLLGLAWKRKATRNKLKHVETAMLQRVGSSINENVSVVMPPEASAPPLNPAFSANA